jgi:hypothetical protein
MPKTVNHNTAEDVQSNYDPLVPKRSDSSKGLMATPEQILEADRAAGLPLCVELDRGLIKTRLSQEALL